MADNTKQGPKDITDLKARLGLKKQGGGPGGPGVPGPSPGAPFALAPIPGSVGAVVPCLGQAFFFVVMGGGIPALGSVFVFLFLGFISPPEVVLVQSDLWCDLYVA